MDERRGRDRRPAGAELEQALEAQKDAAVVIVQRRFGVIRHRATDNPTLPLATILVANLHGSGPALTVAMRARDRVLVDDISEGAR